MGLNPYTSSNTPLTRSDGGVTTDANGNLLDAQGRIVKTKAQLDADLAAQQAYANEQNKAAAGDDILRNGPLGTALDITGINPTLDLIQGHPGDALNDYASGATLGLVSPDQANTATKGLEKLPAAVAAAPVDAAKDVATGIGDALSKLGLPSLGASTTDASSLDAVKDRAFNTQDAYQDQYVGLDNNPTKAPQAGLVQLDETHIDPLRQQQTSALQSLADAAAGKTPSPAELQAKAQADKAAAQSFGAAAALQGGSSAGGALRQALDAGAQTQADVANSNATLRANEQTTARNQLVQGLANARGQESTDATTNANLDQGKNIANVNAATTTHGQDVSEKGDLIQGANADLATGEKAASDKVNADEAAAASANALKGAEIGGAASVLGSIPAAIAKSDLRAKKNIKKTDLIQLADAIEGGSGGIEFEYKDEKNGPGRRVGVVAQDVKKGGPIGKQLVRVDGDEELSMDVPNVMGASLALAAHALKEAEKAVKAAKKGRR